MSEPCLEQMGHMGPVVAALECNQLLLGQWGWGDFVRGLWVEGK